MIGGLNPPLAAAAASIATLEQRIVVLQRELMDLRHQQASMLAVIAKQNDSIVRLAVAVIALQELASDETLPGEKPLPPELRRLC